MLAATSFICADEPAPDLICSVCLDTWRNPVEVKPCSHIFCDECINHVPAIQQCPECRAFIEAFKPPNRVLQRLAGQVKVACGGCGWKGTRDESVGHRCFVTPKGALPPNMKLHTVSDAVVQQLCLYFKEFGGVSAAAGSPPGKTDDVIVSKKGFFEFLKCFRYGDTKEDLEKIYSAVRGIRSPQPRDGSVSANALAAFLAKYPAEPQRLYKLGLEDYHTCMYSLHMWFEKGGNGGEKALLPPDEQMFSPKEFITFATQGKYLRNPESSKERKKLEQHWMPLVDAVDKDGKVSRHEAMRFMSSCIRVSSLRDDNFEEHLCEFGDAAHSPELPRGSGTQCCSIQ